MAASSSSELVTQLRKKTQQLNDERTELKKKIREYDQRIDQITRDLRAYALVIARESGEPVPFSDSVNVSETCEVAPSVWSVGDISVGFSNSNALSPSASAWSTTRSTLGGLTKESPSYWTRALEGLSQHDALVAIAEKNGGTLRVTNALRILRLAGLSKSSQKNLSSYVYATLADSKRFKKIDPGVYELIPDVSERPLPEEENYDEVPF